MAQRIKATIGSYLVALVMLAVIPLMIIAGLLIWRQSVLQRDAFERSLLQTAQALSVAVDRQLQSQHVMLETLAQSPFIDSANLAAFHAMCARVIKQQRQGLFISLFDGEGRQLFNTLRPLGEPLPTPFQHPAPPDPERPPVGDPWALKEVLRTGKPVVSDLLFGLVAERLLFTVNVPVMRDGKIRYVLNAGFEPEVMTHLLQESPQFKGVPAVIFDRRGFIVGRWQDADKYVGQRVTAHQMEQLRTKDAGVASGETLEGIGLYYSFARSPVTGWTASMGAERRQLERAVVEAAQAREARARREEAEAASTTKDRYIATLSHELRNPLAAISNAVHLLRMETEKEATLDMMQR